MQNDIYFSQETYDRLVTALLEAPRTCPVTGKPDVDGIKIALAEAGNVWPLALLVADLAEPAQPRPRVRVPAPSVPVALR